MSRTLPFSLASALTLVSLTAALPLYARPQNPPASPNRSEGKPAPVAPLFMDVPRENGSYARLHDLQQKGIVMGYPEGFFSGKRPLTRYEFATAILHVNDSRNPLTLAQDGKTLQPTVGIPHPLSLEQARELLAVLIEFQPELQQIGFKSDAFQRVRKTLEVYVAANTVSEKAAQLSEKATQLFRACESGNLQSVRELVAGGVDVNARNADGKTPLMAAAYYEDGTVANKNVTSLSMVKYLLSKGAKVNLLDNSYVTALMLAAIKANDDVTKLLLSQGATAHVTLLDPATLVLSETENNPEIIYEYRLHVGEFYSEGSSTGGQRKRIVGIWGWKRPTDEHYRNTFALLKSKVRPSGQ